MRRLPWEMTLIFLTACGSATAEVKTTYDRFKDRTNIVAARPVDDVAAFGGLHLVWQANYTGQAIQTKPSEIAFAVMSGNRSWEYLRCHDVAFLADGKPVITGKSTHNGRVLKGFVHETVITPVSAASLEQLRRAQKIEMQLCRKEHAFDEKDVQVLREFVTSITPQKQ